MAQTSSTRTHYDGVTQSLHWLIAILVVATYAIGFGRELVPKGDFRSWMLVQHFSLGLIMLALVLVRILWRVKSAQPAALPMAPHAHLAARAAHLGLYAMMIVVPVLGLVAAWIRGRTVALFGNTLSSPFATNVDLGKFIEGIHELTAHGFMVLALIHAVAAIGHHFWLGDDTLQRMLPNSAAKGF